MPTWGAYLNTQDLLGRADAGAGAAASAADDGVLMQQGLKRRQTPRVLEDAGRGDGGVLQQGGRAGAQDHVQGCHDAKAPPDGDEAAAPVTEKKRPRKEAAVVARLTPEVLVEAKGIAMVYKAFPKVSFKGAATRSTICASCSTSARRTPSGGRAHPGGREHPATH